MNVRPILTLTFAVLLAGCGTTRRMQTAPVANVPAADSAAPKPVRILHPKHGGYTPSETAARPGDGAVSSLSPESVQKQHQNMSSAPKTDYPELRFTTTQSANIRVPGINPLPAEGILALSLDRMKSDFCYPYRGKLISDYGIRGRSNHTGVDIKAVPNDTIRAAFPGVVRMSKYYSGYGNLVVIQHYYGFETCYGHCSRNLVKENDVVEAGTPIALAGRTGRATTEHLHFEFRSEGQHIDPKKLIDPDTHSLRDGMLYVQRRGSGLIAYNAPAGTPPRSFAAESARETDAPDSNLPETSAGTAAAKTAASKSTAAKSAASAPVYYRVKKGDTLYAIARRYGTTVKKLCAMNGISETALLQLNQRLRVK